LPQQQICCVAGSNSRFALCEHCCISCLSLGC
jgi:hypothetical protein